MVFKNSESKIISRLFVVIWRHITKVIKGHFFSVINGLRPVNLKDYRNKSGNDGVGVSVKSGNDRREKHLSTPNSALLCHSLPQGAREYGRSMIEMLGVLAIIGVLSVGGIAGYSKAMEKWKVNKAVADYTYLIQGLMEQRTAIIKSKSITGEEGLVDLAQSTDLTPPNWEKIDDAWISDEYGNEVHLYSTKYGLFNLPDRITFDIALGGYYLNADNNKTSPNFSEKLCLEIYKNLVVPLHSALMYGGLFRSTGSHQLFGDGYCQSDNRKCLKDLTPVEINDICRSCDKKAQRCAISLMF